MMKIFIPILIALGLTACTGTVDMSRLQAACTTLDTELVQAEVDMVATDVEKVEAVEKLRAHRKALCATLPVLFPTAE